LAAAGGAIVRLDLERVEYVEGQMTVDDLLRPRLLSLFTGYGGLDMAATAVLGADVIGHAEIDPAACRVLAHRYPHVPNVGDVTAVDWSALGPVDVITGGFPCQDVSLAGRRLGIRHDTRSGLWAHMAAAVDELRPALVVIENVRGLLSAEAAHPAHDVLEPCAWCVGDDSGVPLRALGAVLGDLADLGYDAAWRLLSAADVGAPHGRARVFVVAWPADPDGAGLEGDRAGRLPSAGIGGAVSDPGAAADTEGDGQDEGWTESAGELGGPDAAERGAADDPDRWGPYGRAVARWAAVLGRPAPEPIERTGRGTQRLSPRFVEWMMGLPAGWVTDVPGVTRNDALRLLGNGVVPQQAAAAVAALLADVAAVKGTAPPPEVGEGAA
jgi:DNA (cytosine-5)-methyltransferase 1